MTFTTIATGSFPTHNNNVVKVDIQADNTAGLTDLGELRFPYDEPLIIEWSEASKEETVLGSTATLKIISPSDRAYECLYTIKPALIRLVVYYNDALYWSGTLDPEFYEEPYTDTENYEVSFTFSDFGILERFKYQLTGIQSINNILNDALTRLQLYYNAINTDFISLKDSSGNSLTLDDIAIRSDNFIDEDGELSNLQEVIEGLLQPLALRIIQRNGNIYVYDINGLYNNATTTQIQWNSDDQTMSTDKVYNNVKITFSPYASSDIICPEIDWQGLDTIDDPTKGLSTGQEFDAYYPSYDSSTMKYTNASGVETWDYGNISFCIIRSSDTSNSNLVTMNGTYFKIVAMNGGEDSEGVAWGYYTGGHGSLASGYPTLRGKSPATSTEMTFMKTTRFYLPQLDTATAKYYRLTLIQEVLLDTRYNPFEQASDGNESGNYETSNNKVHAVGIPFKATLYSAETDGTALYHYNNYSVVTATFSSNGTPNIYTTQGSWVAGSASWDDAWLMYYDADNLNGGQAMNAWQTNRQAIWLCENTTGSLKSLDDGQLMPYPPCGGWLDVEIGGEISTFATGSIAGTSSSGTFHQLLLGNNYDTIGKIVRWRLYKLPQISLKRFTTVLDDIDNEDIVYKGTLNAEAEEDLEINTICGTARSPIPTAKGNFLLASSETILQTVQRAGRTDTAEQLLIGTLYSQFAERKTKLTGTAILNFDALTLYTEAMQSSKKFLATHETQTLDTEETEITLIETNPDEYTAS